MLMGSLLWLQTRQQVLLATSARGENTLEDYGFRMSCEGAMLVLSALRVFSLSLSLFLSVGLDRDSRE